MISKERDCMELVGVLLAFGPTAGMNSFKAFVVEDRLDDRDPLRLLADREESDS
jgi:hypothetical protein